jgi:hypothetical protein
MTLLRTPVYIWSVFNDKAVFPPYRPEFDLAPRRVGLEVDKEAMGQFSPSASVRQFTDVSEENTASIFSV